MTKRIRPGAATPCIGCGTNGRRLGDLCWTCLGREPDALHDGKWVMDMRRRVLVWQPDPRPPGAPPRTPRPVSHNTERGYQWHRSNDPHNWPLPPDDPCGCRAAHAAHNTFKAHMKAREAAAREDAA